MFPSASLQNLEEASGSIKPRVPLALSLHNNIFSYFSKAELH